jgi:hypothetical protein
MDMQTVFLLVGQPVVETSNCQSASNSTPGHLGHLYRISSSPRVILHSYFVIRTTARREEAEKESGVFRGN